MSAPLLVMIVGRKLSKNKSSACSVCDLFPFPYQDLTRYLDGGSGFVIEQPGSLPALAMPLCHMMMLLLLAI
jgi:hypothetical protein